MVGQQAGGQSEGDGGKTDGLCDGTIASALAFKALRKEKCNFLKRVFGFGHYYFMMNFS